MNNKFLDYLLDDKQDTLMLKFGLKIRKVISPLYRNVMLLFTNSKLDKNKTIKDDNNNKIIYACTHSFYDDILYSMKIANNHTYLLYGNLKDFFKTFHGIGLWINGVILVDRTNKLSRKLSIEKMINIINLGGNVIIFPEGTWNLNESLPILELHLGIYDVASKTGARIIPIATYLNNNVTYFDKGNAIDITNIDNETHYSIINNQLKLINKCLDLLIYNTLIEDNIKQSLLNIINILENNQDIKLVEYKSNILINEILEYKTKINKEMLLYSILDRVENILKLVVKQEKILCVEKLRDELATLKWNLYIETKRDEIKDNYWEEHTKELISLTNRCYDYEEEKNSMYINPEKYMEEDIFSCLDNVELTRENAKVLMLTRNKLIKK